MGSASMMQLLSEKYDFAKKIEAENVNEEIRNFSYNLVEQLRVHDMPSKNF